jgi:hypothetical protein
MSGFSCLSHGYPSITVSRPRDVTRKMSPRTLPCIDAHVDVFLNSSILVFRSIDVEDRYFSFELVLREFFVV